MFLDQDTGPHRRLFGPRHHRLVDALRRNCTDYPNRGPSLIWRKIVRGSGKRLLKIAMLLYIAQVAAVIAVGSTLPFLRYFGVL